MKKKEIKSVIEGIKKIKLGKLEEKSISTALFKDFMKLCGEQRALEASQKDLQELFLEKHKEEQETVSRLQSDFNLESNAQRRMELAREINSHTEYLDAVKELNDKMEALANEEVEVEYIDGEKFGEAFQKQSDWDISVIEEIYPLFK